MRKTRNALFGILTMMSGAILAVPTEAAERYIPSVPLYKAVPERLFSYPYGGSYLKRAKRAFGNPYVNPYYGSYYAPQLPLSLLLVMRRLQQQFFTLGPLA
jgi:hypothetical protein